jgi:hypothetical protein
MKTTKLTEQWLIDNDFENAGTDSVDIRRYRKDYSGYPFTIQITIGDYPSDNPNCGIVSIYMPEEKNMPAPTNDDLKNTIDFPEINQPIAWFVDTVERLEFIIDALTLI